MPRKKGGAGGGPKEEGAIKKSWRGRLPVALCYPNRYEVAMGSLAFHHLYHLFNLHDDVACERIVLDPSGAASRSIESGAPLRAFRVIAATLSYETDLVNLARMLLEAGVPADPGRRRDLESPLVLAGGAVCGLNPEPLAPWADVISVGEAEVTVPAFLSAARTAMGDDLRAAAPLMARAEGLYVPGFYRVALDGQGRVGERSPLVADAPAIVRRAVSADLSAAPARTRVFSERAEFGELFLIELARGCGHGCRFCAAGYALRPPRYVSAETVAAELEAGFAFRDKAGLVCASATDHPEFGAIRRFIRERGKTHSVASLRLDQITAELLEEIRACGHRTLTVAPEAGSERLRAAINKPIDDLAISRAAELIGASGLPRLKLYFQVGLPFETGSDVAGIAPLVAMIKGALAKGAGQKSWRGMIGVTLNPFVPKPGTPFQWRELEAAKSLEAKLTRAGKELARLGGVEVAVGSVREAQLQAAIARGGRWTGEVIAAAVAAGQNPLTYLKAGHGQTPPLESYVHRRFEADSVLPWDFIDHRVAKAFLWKEHERAQAGQTSPPCRPGHCERCDACRPRARAGEKTSNPMGRGG